MENSIFIGLSRQIALDRQMSLVANNIANVNTPGYRAQNMVFTEYLENPKSSTKKMSMVLDYGQFQSTAPGSIRQTGNQLDIAIEGQGFLGVQSTEGLAYSRAGRLSLNINGELVNAAGLPVVNDGGSPITIPADAREITIAQDGSVSTDKGVISKLKLVEFANEQDLEPFGNNLYRSTAAPRPAENSRIIQGAYEDSNVQAVLEMTRMIDVSRQFQSVQRMLQGEHDRQRTMIQKLTQTS